MSERFRVVDNTRVQDTKGEWKHIVRFNNRKDAVIHCDWLNKREQILSDCIKDNVEYYTCLEKIKWIVESIQEYTEEVYTLEKLIRIKKLLKERL